MFTKCIQIRKKSYSLGPDLSLDTLIDDLSAFFQNLNKSRLLLTSTKQTNQQTKTQDCVLGLGDIIHQV
jgi:hypothetical protein